MDIALAAPVRGDAAASLPQRLQLAVQRLDERAVTHAGQRPCTSAWFDRCWSTSCRTWPKHCFLTEEESTPQIMN